MVGTEVAPRSDIRKLTFENARIIFRNFSGKEGQYNREGDRNFCLVIDNDIADDMKADGWNVKYLKPRDIEDDAQAYIQVAVSSKQRPPRIVMITERKGELAKTDVPEDLWNVIDWVEIANVDLIINPYSWGPINGRSGIKAYLSSIYITILQDELEQKYADVPDSGQNVLPATIEMLELEDPNIIDAEIVEED